MLHKYYKKSGFILFNLKDLIQKFLYFSLNNISCRKFQKMRCRSEYTGT